MNPAEFPSLLNRLHAELIATFGDRLQTIYLYGSQARGDSRPDSDIDIMIVFRDEFDYFDVVDQTSHVTSDLSLEYDTVISCVFVTQRDFEQRHTPLLLNVRREGVLV
jgi:predicted nucleotidyltransferase